MCVCACVCHGLIVMDPSFPRNYSQVMTGNAWVAWPCASAFAPVMHHGRSGWLRL